MKPASYPFLTIARKYGLDYAAVLAYADIHRGDTRTYKNLTPLEEYAVDLISAVEPDYVVCLAIIEANEQFRAIQAGKIDWLTGAVSAITGDFGAPHKADLMRPLKTPLLDAETLKPLPGTGGVELEGTITKRFGARNPPRSNPPRVGNDCPRCGMHHLNGTACGEYYNGAPMYAPDGTMLDEHGNRSIFDDVDDEE